MISPPALRRLIDVRLTDAAEVGGKAASLGELLADGVHVPDGVVLPAGAEDLSPEERASLLQDSTAHLGAGPFAVRSSGVSEDGNERSFAGMFESVLNVSREDLAGAVDRCLASAETSRVAGYHADGGAGMAVIVQQMVPAVAAGVAAGSLAGFAAAASGPTRLSYSRRAASQSLHRCLPDFLPALVS